MEQKKKRKQHSDRENGGVERSEESEWARERERVLLYNVHNDLSPLLLLLPPPSMSVLSPQLSTLCTAIHWNGMPSSRVFGVIAVKVTVCIRASIETELNWFPNEIVIDLYSHFNVLCQCTHSWSHRLRFDLFDWMRNLSLCCNNQGQIKYAKMLR